MSSRPTAAAVIIATEVLTAKVQDANTPVLARWLRARGIRLSRVVVIEDDVDVIAAEVRAASAATHVFTSGGVGPTHDDLTMAGIAAAFDVPVEPHPALLQALEGVPAGPRRDGLRRMCNVPRGTELLYPEGHRWPTLRLRNVFILPGVPSFFEKKLEALGPWVLGPPLFAGEVVTLAAETDIVDQIDAVVGRHPGVSIGSYPIFEPQGSHTRLTVDGPTRQAVEAALRDFEASLPVSSVRSVRLPEG